MPSPTASGGTVAATKVAAYRGAATRAGIEKTPTIVVITSGRGIPPPPSLCEADRPRDEDRRHMRAGGGSPLPAFVEHRVRRLSWALLT